MFIKELYEKKEPVISFEVFPPKQESSLESITDSLAKMASLNPGFISVTYGAGGTGNNSMTTSIASIIENKLGATPMAHLTAVAAKTSDIAKILKELKANNIFNIMALRGDLPENFLGNPNGDFQYAYQLIEFIKENGDFCCGGAFYPEAHITCENLNDNYAHAYAKQAAGADFLVSQLFFDNEKFYNFADNAVKKGITIPLVAGIMPILGKSQVQRMIFQCGVSLPSSIIRILHKYENNPADLQKAGIEYACKQIESLFENGHKYIHIYSMNKPEIAIACKTTFDDLVSRGE
jgi:methylenetetrahydrofolate reductase (NADPH)